MNKQKLTIIFQSLIMATLICISVIFIIKYVFEVQLVKEELDKLSSEVSTNATLEDITTAISADVSIETESEDYIDLSDIPLTDRTYTVDEYTYDNDALMFPCKNYNYAIMMKNPVYLDSAYPEFARNALITQTSLTNLKDYVEKIYETYIQLFGDDFIISNSLVNTTVLNHEELENMRMYYNQCYNEDFDIKYAVIMETVCTITYTKTVEQEISSDSAKNTTTETSSTEDLSSNIKELLSDSETEYFISYFYNGKWYMDYIYTDYYFYN